MNVLMSRVETESDKLALKTIKSTRARDVWNVFAKCLKTGVRVKTHDMQFDQRARFYVLGLADVRKTLLVYRHCTRLGNKMVFGKKKSSNKSTADKACITFYMGNILKSIKHQGLASSKWAKNIVLRGITPSVNFRRLTGKFKSTIYFPELMQNNVWQTSSYVAIIFDFFITFFSDHNELKETLTLFHGKW